MRARVLLSLGSLLLVLGAVWALAVVLGGERWERRGSEAGLASQGAVATEAGDAAEPAIGAERVAVDTGRVDEPGTPSSASARALTVLVLRESDRAPLAGFEVALMQGGEPRARAVSDALGHAVLEVDDGVVGTARLQPHGWVGPTHTFPELDAGRLPADPVTLLVPAFGFVEFALLRDGQPAPDGHLGWSRIEGWESVHAPGLPPELAGDPDVQVRRDYAVDDPLRVGPLALGLSFRCILALRELPGTQWNDALTGPTRPGEVVSQPIELGPDEGQCSLLLLAPDGEPLRARALDTVGLYLGTSDRPAWRPTVLRELQSDDEGRVSISLRGRSSEGVVLQRVAVWVGRLHGSLEVGRFPSPGEDLGRLRFEAPEPTVRGVVFDAGSGNALAGAHVTLVIREGLHDRAVVGGPVLTDDRGRFALFQDVASANPLRLFVVTADGLFHDHGAVKDGDDVEVRVREQGAVEVTFEPPADPETPRPVVELRRGLFPVSFEGREVWEGTTLWRQEGLPAGTFDLALRNGPYGEDLLVVEGVQVPARGVLRDPRLQGLRLDGLIRRVRFEVRDSRGRPLPGAELTREVDGPASSFRSKEDREVTAADGTAVFQVPGTLRELEVRVVADGHATQRLTVPVAVGSRTVVRLDRN